MAHKIQIGHAYTHKILSTSTQSYLSDLLKPYVPSRLLHSTSASIEQNLFSVLVPCVYVLQLSGIPLKIRLVNPKPFLHLYYIYTVSEN